VNLARLIRLQGWVVLVRLVLIGMGAVIAADAANQWLLAQWRIIPTPPTPASVVRPAARPAPTSYRGVVRRNVFNSAPTATAPVADAPMASGDATPAAPVVEPLNLNVRLTGTVVSPSANQSYAFIYETAARREKLYRVGERVLGEGVVATIERTSVRLTRGGAEQILRLFEEKKKKPLRGGRRIAVGAAPTRSPEYGNDEAVEARTMDRQELDEALADLPRLLTQARLLPNFRAGVTDGFRIFNIVPGSLFAKIGLRNGDVLHRINDVEIRDPTKFMGLFASLKDAPRITLDLVRGNNRKTFEYEIR